MRPMPAIVPLGIGEAADPAGLRQLFEEVFGQPVSAAHWAWKYGPAAGGRGLHRVAAAAGPLVGHVGARIMPGCWQGQPARLAHLTDVMVHPQARDGLQASTPYAQLMRAMAQALVQQAPPGATPLFAYGFPGLTPARLGRRMGLYRPLGRVQAYRVAFAACALAGAQRPWTWRVRLANGTPGGHEPPTAPAADWPAAWLDQQWARMAPQQAGPVVRKDSAYLAWRYRDHPTHRYQLWQVLAPWSAPVVGWGTAAGGWLVTRLQPQSVVVDSLLPLSAQQPQAWLRILQALAQVSGQAEWTTWRPVQGSVGTSPMVEVHRETSLIVPVEFRADELSEGGPSAWAQHDAAHGLVHPLRLGTAGRADLAGHPPAGHPAVGTTSGGPLFQPGDTDVF